MSRYVLVKKGHVVYLCVHVEHAYYAVVDCTNQKFYKNRPLVTRDLQIYQISMDSVLNHAIDLLANRVHPNDYEQNVSALALSGMMHALHPGVFSSFIH